MSEDFSFADIVESLPSVMDDIMNSEQQPKIAMILILTEDEEKCTSNLIINTGPEDAIRLMYEAIAILTGSLAKEPETRQ